MTLKEIISRFMGKEEQDDDEPREIRDRHLESLRRERQVQTNEVEKQDLKIKIAEYKKKKMREHLFGIKDKREREKQFLGEVQQKKVQVLQHKKGILKAQNVMKQKSILRGKSILSNRKKEFKKIKPIL